MTARKVRRGRPSEGLTPVGARLTDDEAQMVRDIAALLKVSQNKGIRWAIRYAAQHASSTDDHTLCTRNSPCATATRGLTPGRQRDAATEGQLFITHTATLE